MIRFAKFLLVGSFGFLADVGLLYVMIYIVGFDPFLGRAVSIVSATALTWRLNRSFTFSPSAGPQVYEGARYFSVIAATSLVNYLCYSILLLVLPGLSPALALACGSIVALGFSYTGLSRLVFQY